MSPFSREKLASTLFQRYEGNPILTSDNWPYPINAVFNPAAVLIDGEVLLSIGYTWPEITALHDRNAI